MNSDRAADAQAAYEALGALPTAEQGQSWSEGWSGEPRGMGATLQGLVLNTARCQGCGTLNTPDAATCVCGASTDGWWD